jgi:hypothetical protein
MKAAPDAFIARWEAREGGQERANYALFLSEVCDVIGVPRPDPSARATDNDYVIERAVKRQNPDGQLRRWPYHDNFVLGATTCDKCASYPRRGGFDGV